MMARTCSVRVNDETFVANCGDLLLDAALMNGIDIPHDCRSGHCGTCKVRVVSGQVFGAKGDTQVLNPIETDQIAVWDVESEKTPLAFRVVVANIVPFSGGFTVAVPGITVDGLALKETTYNVPLRAAASNLIGDLKGVVNNLKIDPNASKLFFQGTGKIGKRDIEVTVKVNGQGELSADFGRDFEREATIEIVKLALKSTLKAAVKTTIGGEAAIKGTFEILYLIGYDLKQA